MIRENASSRFPTILLAALLAAFPLASHAADATADPPPKDPPADAQRSVTGLAMIQTQKGYGSESPDGNDYVAFHFTLWTPAGVKAQSSYDAGQPMNLPMDKVLPAWREALGQMVKGEKRRLWVPEHLTPRNPQSGPKGAVICDVELMAFRALPNLPPDHLTPPDDAERTMFGAYSKVIEKGTGTQKGVEGSGVLAHFTLWTEDGKIHDSTHARERPTLFIYEKVMPAFADVLKLMVDGEKRLIWIPGNVANGNWVGAPKGMLIFQAEVLNVVTGDILAPPGSVAPKSGSPGG